MCCDCAASAGPSMRMPARSMSRQHRHERHLQLANTSLELVGDEQRREPVRQLPGEVRALAGEVQRVRRRQPRDSGTAFAPRPQTSSSVSAL